MTKKKEKKPPGRPTKKQKEIFTDGEGDKPDSPPTPAFKKAKPPAVSEPQVGEDTLDLSAKPKEKQEGEGYTCAGCKGKLSGEKPKYCPNCGILLNWEGVA